MVPILVLLAITGFLALDWHLIRRRRNARRTALATRFEGPADLFFHPGHSWVRPTADGLVSVGATDFASHFAGDLQRIELPPEGRRLRRGEPAWTLVSRRGRRLTQVMPVDGKVLAVNEDLRRNPATAQTSPFTDGWVLRVRPRRLRSALSGLLRGRAATAWRDAVCSAVIGAPGPALGRVARDGGEWIAGFGERLDDAVWEEARRELFPSVETSASAD